MEEFELNRSVCFRFSWLQGTYVSMVKHFMYQEATRVYLLHLIGCTILENKLHVYIDVRYIDMFIVFVFHSWAWDYVVVTLLHHVIVEAATFKTRQIYGYMSLFQVYK